MASDDKCVTLNNIPLQQGVVPLRITVVLAGQVKKDCYTFYNMINAIINVLKIPVKMIFRPAFGKLVDGKWNGAMGELANNETDVLMPGYSVTYDRFEWSQPSVPIGYSSPISILSGRISTNTLRNDFHVFNTFSWGVWIGIMISIILIGITDYFIHERFMEKIISKIILAYAFFMRQGSEHVATYCCIHHVILWGISLLCFSVLGYYFGNYILTDQLQNSFITIDSMDDVVKLLESTTSNISVVAFNGFLTWQLMENSREKNFQKVFKHLIPKLDFGYDEIYKGRRVAIQYDVILLGVINGIKLNGFHLSRDRYFGSALCIYYSKAIDNNVKEKIDSVIYSLYETGLQGLWSKFNIPVKIKQDENDDNDKQSNDMDSVRGLFILLFSINLSTIIILILEKLIYNSYSQTREL